MNNDLISRKWLIDAIRNRRTYLSYEDAKDVIDLINNAPTVPNEYMRGYEAAEREYKRPQGEWIKVNNPDTNIWTGGLKCSECDRGCVQESMNFCANCGAKMTNGNKT